MDKNQQPRQLAVEYAFKADEAHYQMMNIEEQYPSASLKEIKNEIMVYECLCTFWRIISEINETRLQNPPIIRLDDWTGDEWGPV